MTTTAKTLFLLLIATVSASTMQQKNFRLPTNDEIKQKYANKVIAAKDLKLITLPTLFPQVIDSIKQIYFEQFTEDQIQHLQSTFLKPPLTNPRLRAWNNSQFPRQTDVIMSLDNSVSQNHKRHREFPVITPSIKNRRR